MSNDNRDKIRALQDRVIAIAEDRGLQQDVPISSIQVDAPTIKDLKAGIWPGFEPSMQSFLEHFEGGSK